jgi:hypothetical protein
MLINSGRIIVKALGCQQGHVRDARQGTWSSSIVLPCGASGQVVNRWNKGSVVRRVVNHDGIAIGAVYGPPPNVAA